MKLFDKVMCKGFYKPVNYECWAPIDKSTISDCSTNLILDYIFNHGNDKEYIDCIEKTYYKRVQQKFTGVIVGFKDLVIKCYTDYSYINKIPKETIKCAVVYYGNNKKHFVSVDDIIDVEV